MLCEGLVIQVSIIRQKLLVEFHKHFLTSNDKSISFLGGKCLNLTKWGILIEF